MRAAMSLVVVVVLLLPGCTESVPPEEDATSPAWETTTPSPPVHTTMEPTVEPPPTTTTAEPPDEKENETADPWWWAGAPQPRSLDAPATTWTAYDAVPPSPADGVLVMRATEFLEAGSVSDGRPAEGWIIMTYENASGQYMRNDVLVGEESRAKVEQMPLSRIAMQSQRGLVWSDGGLDSDDVMRVAGEHGVFDYAEDRDVILQYELRDVGFGPAWFFNVADAETLESLFRLVLDASSGEVVEGSPGAPVSFAEALQIVGAQHPEVEAMLLVGAIGYDGSSWPFSAFREFDRSWVWGTPRGLDLDLFDGKATSWLLVFLERETEQWYSFALFGPDVYVALTGPEKVQSGYDWMPRVTAAHEHGPPVISSEEFVEIAYEGSRKNTWAAADLLVMTLVSSSGRFDGEAGRGWAWTALELGASASGWRLALDADTGEIYLPWWND